MAICSNAKIALSAGRFGWGTNSGFASLSTEPNASFGEIGVGGGASQPMNSKSGFGCFAARNHLVCISCVNICI